MERSFSADDILRFYDICNDAYICWRIRRVLFDDNKNMDKILQKCGNANWCLVTIGTNLAELFVLKIGKLHDPYKNKSNTNLSLDCIMEYCSIDIKRKKYSP